MIGHVAGWVVTLGVVGVVVWLVRWEVTVERRDREFARRNRVRVVTSAPRFDRPRRDPSPAPRRRRAA